MQDHPITTITSHCYEKFKAHTKFYGLFHTLFISFLAMQVLSFCLFFSLLSKSLFAAIALALFFFTLFSYFVLLFFFQTKKPQQLLTLRQEFLDRCLPYLPPKEDPHSHQIPLAKAIDYFASLLDRKSVV